MADNRTFPDVEFITRTPEDIFADLVSTWEAEMGRTLAMTDPYRLILGWEAAIDAQLYAAINESARLNMPRYAFGDYLDSLSELFYQGLTRLEASPATTTIRFTISTTAQSSTPIPEGTRCTADGTAVFRVTETAYIQPGSLYADVPAECTTDGTIGNGYAAGTINICMDPDNVQNLLSVENTTASEGGAAEETDEAFYERMRESMGAWSTAGSEESYIYFAKSASAEVSGVSVHRPEAGKVDVYILKEDGGAPGAELIATVQEYLSGETVRPLTDHVTVKAPSSVNFDIAFTWYLATDSAMNQLQAEAAVEAAVQEYLAWQTTEIGRDINPSMLTKLLMETGIKRVEITSPEFTQVGANSVAVLGETEITFGGTENV